MEILLSKAAITIFEIVIIFVLFIVLILQKRKNKAMQKRRKIANVKMRNVQHSHKANVNSPQIAKNQVGIEVHTKTKYLFDMDQEITIGQDEKNVLSLHDKRVAKHCCTIFMRNQAVYVKNQNSMNAICIQRGKNKQLIQNQMVRLHSKDILTVGNTSMYISVHENL